MISERQRMPEIRLPREDAHRLLQMRNRLLRMVVRRVHHAEQEMRLGELRITLQRPLEPFADSIPIPVGIAKQHGVFKTGSSARVGCIGGTLQQAPRFFIMLVPERYQAQTE